MYKNEIRDLLSNKDKEIFDKIENHFLLGATNHIKAIGDMIQNISENPNYSLEESKNKIKKIAMYYINTRGKASKAIINAICIMIKDIDSKNSSTEIIKQKNSYFLDNEKNKKKILEYAVNISKKFQTIMCYDYSSMVEAFLIELSKDNKNRTIYIPESRIINGGEPFIKSIINLNYDIKFIPDCSVFYFMNLCEACYMGAETIYPDGTGFNTTGSDLIGLVCNYLHKPLYFITPMIKLDTNFFHGIEKKTVIDDLKEKMTCNWKITNIEKIDFNVPELIGVKSDFIEAFITEYGIIPAKQMYSVANNYAKLLNKGDQL